MNPNSPDSNPEGSYPPLQHLQARKLQLRKQQKPPVNLAGNQATGNFQHRLKLVQGKQQLTQPPVNFAGNQVPGNFHQRPILVQGQQQLTQSSVNFAGNQVPGNFHQRLALMPGQPQIIQHPFNLAGAQVLENFQPRPVIMNPPSTVQMLPAQGPYYYQNSLLGRFLF